MSYHEFHQAAEAFNAQQAVEQQAAEQQRLAQERIQNLQQAEQAKMSLYNDVAEFNIYGSRGRTYTHPVSGEVLATAENPTPGRLEELRATRPASVAAAYEKNVTDLTDNGYELAQAQTIADAELANEGNGMHYASVRNLFDRGLTIGQVNMIRNARNGERAAVDAQTRRFEDQGMDPIDARTKARDMYRARDSRRVNDIFNNAIANSTEYEAFRASGRKPNFREEAAAQQEAERQEAEQRQEALSREANAARRRLGEPTVEHLQSGVTVIEWLNENGHATRVVELDPRNGRTTVNERDMDADGNVLSYETVGNRQIPALRRQINYEFKAGELPQAVRNQIESDPAYHTADAITDPHQKAAAARRDAANRKRALDAAYAAVGGEVNSYVLEPGAKVGESTRVNRGRVQVTNRAGNFLTHGNGTRPGERFTDVIADIEQDINNGNVLPENANQVPAGRARRLGRAALRALPAAGRAIQNRRANNANTTPGNLTPRQQRRQGRRNLRAAAQARRNGTGLIQGLQQNPPRRNP